MADHLTDTGESEADRQRRLAWEAERIAEAIASIETEGVIDHDDVWAWLESIGTDHELPRPQPKVSPEMCGAASPTRRMRTTTSKRPGAG